MNVTTQRRFWWTQAADETMTWSRDRWQAYSKCIRNPNQSKFTRQSSDRIEEKIRQPRTGIYSHACTFHDHLNETNGCFFHWKTYTTSYILRFLVGSTCYVLPSWCDTASCLVVAVNFLTDLIVLSLTKMSQTEKGINL